MAVDVQEDLVAFLSELLGRESAAYFARVTEAGLLSLEKMIKNGLVCLCLNGVPKDSKAREVLSRLIQCRPIRVLDGSSIGPARDRSVTMPVACLILRGDYCDESALGRLLTIRFDPSAAALTHQAKRRLIPTASNAVVDLSVIPCGDRLAAVIRPDLSPVSDRIKQQADIDRIEMVVQLATVWRGLLAGSAADARMLTVTPADLEAVLVLLRQVKAPADQACLSRPAIDCLHMLQHKRDALMLWRLGAKHEVTRGGDEPPGPFTLQGFLQFSEYRDKSEDAVRLWFKELKNAGLLQEQARSGRRKTYDLTQAGLAWKPGLLASHLHGLLQPILTAANTDNESLGLYSPGVGDVAAEQRNSDAVSSCSFLGGSHVI